MSTEENRKRDQKTTEDGYEKTLRQLELDMSLAILDSLEKKLRLIEATLKIESKRTIERMNALCEMKFDVSHSNVTANGTMDYSVTIEMKLKSINERIATYCHSLTECTENLEGIMREIVNVQDYVQQARREGCEQSNEMNGSLKEGTNESGRSNDPYSPQRGRGEVGDRIYFSPSVPKSSPRHHETEYVPLLCSHPMKEGLKERKQIVLSDSLSPGKAVKDVNPYSPQAEKRRKLIKESNTVSSPLKYSQKEERTGLVSPKTRKGEIGYEDRLTSDTSKNVLFNEKQFVPKVHTGNHGRSFLSRDYGLSTQPEQSCNTALSQDGFFTDSDTEYAKLDLERKRDG
jgi:hypothetical protein